MRPIAMKRYELRADSYYSTREIDPETGDTVTTWHYDDPTVIKATGRSVRPWGAIEDFDETYQNKAE